MTLKTLTDSKQIEALKKAFGTTSNRVILPNYADAMTKLNTIASETVAEGTEEPFFGVTIGIKGADGANLEKIDESIYADSAVALGYISARVSGPDGKKVEGIKAIVVFPVPTLDQILADESGKGREFLSKIAEKELNHVFLRGLRDADMTESEFYAGLTEAPATLDEFLTSSAQTSVVDLTVFDAVWDAFKDHIKTSVADLYKAIPKQKAIVVKAFRSAAYAKADPATAPVEQYGLWEKMLAELIASATANDLDASVMQGWADNRATLELSYKAPEVLEDTSVLAGISFAKAPAAQAPAAS